VEPVADIAGDTVRSGRSERGKRKKIHPEFHPLGAFPREPDTVKKIIEDDSEKFKRIKWYKRSVEGWNLRSGGHPAVEKLSVRLYFPFHIPIESSAIPTKGRP
jgi:hypothetical protein